MPKPGMFTQGHINGLTNELAAQITAQCAMSDKVRAARPDARGARRGGAHSGDRISGLVGLEPDLGRVAPRR